MFVFIFVTVLVFLLVIVLFNFDKIKAWIKNKFTKKSKKEEKPKEEKPIEEEKPNLPENYATYWDEDVEEITAEEIITPVKETPKPKSSDEIDIDALLGF